MVLLISHKKEQKGYDHRQVPPSYLIKAETIANIDLPLPILRSKANYKV
jgi:hypothetical protein